MDAWDDDGADVDRLLNRIIYGVLHHPAQRDMGEDGAEEGRQLMFSSIEEWWNDLGEDAREEYRQKLSRDGVMNGENHKEGVQDCGHGCGKPLGMHKNFKNEAPETMEDRIAAAAADRIVGGVKQGFSDFLSGQASNNQGNLFGAVAGGILGGGFNNEATSAYRSGGYEPDGGYSETTTEYGHDGSRYGQAEYTETRYDDGSERQEYRRYEQDDNGRDGYGYEDRRYRRDDGEEYREERRYRRDDEEEYGGGGGGYSRRQEDEDLAYPDPERPSSPSLLDRIAQRAKDAFEERRREYESGERERRWPF